MGKRKREVEAGEGKKLNALKGQYPSGGRRDSR